MAIIQPAQPFPAKALAFIIMELPFKKFLHEIFGLALPALHHIDRSDFPRQNVATLWITAGACVEIGRNGLTKRRVCQSVRSGFDTGNPNGMPGAEFQDRNDGRAEAGDNHNGRLRPPQYRNFLVGRC